MNIYRLGKPLCPGDTIGVVAPSSALAEDTLEQGLAILHGLGYHTKLGLSVGAHWGYLAGTDAARAADIRAAFADNEVDGIICLRGGYGATRLLPLLDYECIAAHPKLFVGFSDITALHTVLLQRCHLAPVHSMMVMPLGRGASDYTVRQFAAGLQDPYQDGAYELPPGCRLETIIPGMAEGILCGGNMMLLAAMTGTPYALDGTGAILLLEEVGEEAYALDRMLCQLEQSGLIERAAGIIFGEFSGCTPVEAAPYEFTVRDVIYEYAARWQKPAVCGFPAGHGADNAWLPFGRSVRLSLMADKADVVRLPDRI